MLCRFFTLAASSPGRQRAFRQAVIAHLALLTGGAWALYRDGPSQAPLLGQLLLVAGIVEGAVFVGWRLTQLPKNRALEFLLVSSLSPGQCFRAEAVVGVARFILITMAGLPVLVFLAAIPGPDCIHRGPLVDWIDLGPLIVMPLTWGIVTGLGLTVWAYEPLAVRRWAERVILVLIAFYLGVGMLAGENLMSWLRGLPGNTGRWALEGFRAFHVYNPFAVMQDWFVFGHGLQGRAWLPWEKALGLELAAVVAAGLLAARAAVRLKGHFHELHYRPAVRGRVAGRYSIGSRPLSWWAVRRVTEYSGQVNLWLASACGILYALYTLAGPSWPPWLGRQAFLIFDHLGGIPGIATALMVLAAVPAAFQYGLWEHNVHSRCRRLELLLLTELDGRDYWAAAAAAAWQRGRGYALVALLLWLAAVGAGKASPMMLATSLAASTILWAFYFAIGFRAFSRGLPATGLGLFLTIGLPLLTYLLYRWQGPAWAALLPPGAVYSSTAGLTILVWFPGLLAAGVGAITLARLALARCDGELRCWYDKNQGRPVGD